MRGWLGADLAVRLVYCLAVLGTTVSDPSILGTTTAKKTIPAIRRANRTIFLMALFLRSELPSRHRNPARQHLVNAATVQIDDFEAPAGNFHVVTDIRQVPQMRE